MHIIDFHLRTGEDRVLNFDLTTGGAQDEAKLLSKRHTGAPGQQKAREAGHDQIGRIFSGDSSAADDRDSFIFSFFEGWFFGMHANLLVRSDYSIFLSKMLLQSLPARGSGFKVQVYVK